MSIEVGDTIEFNISKDFLTEIMEDGTFTIVSEDGEFEVEAVEIVNKKDHLQIVAIVRDIVNQNISTYSWK